MAKRKLKKSKGLWMLVLLTFLVLLFFLMTGNRGFIQQNRARYHRSQLKNKIQDLETLRNDLEVEKKSLDEPETIEKIAREKYGMAKKDETVYRIVPKEE